jgi:hypothetical protein
VKTSRQQGSIASALPVGLLNSRLFLEQIEQAPRLHERIHRHH